MSGSYQNNINNNGVPSSESSSSSPALHLLGTPDISIHMLPAVAHHKQQHQQQPHHSTNSSISDVSTPPQYTLLEELPGPYCGSSATVEPISLFPPCLSTAYAYPPTTTLFHQPQQPSGCFRPFETDGTFVPSAFNSFQSAVGSGISGDRLEGLFKTVNATGKAEAQDRSADYDLRRGQEGLPKSLPPFRFNQFYSPLCLPPTTRISSSFDRNPQPLQPPASVAAPPPNFTLHQLPSNKIRSQNGLMQLLGTATRKRSSKGAEDSEEAGKVDLGMEESGDSAASRSSYMCRKCRAHGRLIAVRQHKRNCPYKHCNCSVCSLVNYGRHIVARQIALYRDQKSHQGGEEATVVPKIRFRDQARIEGDEEEEGPHCRRCRNHGKTNPWKGHKKICPFYYCICQQCILITLRKSNEKNLREVVQDSNKEVSMAKSAADDEVTFPPPLYSKSPPSTKLEKLKKLKSVGTTEQPRSSSADSGTYPESYDQLWWRSQQSSETPAVVTEGQSDPTSFYSSRAQQQAAAFAAAAAAAVAFHHEAAASSLTSSSSSSSLPNSSTTVKQECLQLRAMPTDPQNGEYGVGQHFCAYDASVNENAGGGSWTNGGQKYHHQDGCAFWSSSFSQPTRGDGQVGQESAEMKTLIH